MPRALITGITGQDGWYLAEQLLSEGWEVHGVARNIAPVPPGVQLHLGDAGDPAVITPLVAQVVPDEVYHLAAASSVERAWADAEVARTAPLRLLELLLDALARHAPGARTVVASSSEVFGATRESPQHEGMPLAPATPYGEGKARVLERLRAERARGTRFLAAAILYNHESPRRPPHFLSRKVTLGAARIALGMAQTLPLGALDMRRDWGWAPDHVDALRRMARHPEPLDLVIGTGVAHTVRELCTVAFAAAGLDWTAHVTHDASLLRPADPAHLVADARRARTLLGWAPRCTFDAMIETMVVHDLARLRAGEGC